MGSWTRSHVRPRVVEMETPGSFATMIRFALPGSIHMSWLSPPGVLSGGGRTGADSPGARAAAGAATAAVAPPKPAAVFVAPPSRERLKVAHRKYVSSGLSVDTVRRV